MSIRTSFFSSSLWMMTGRAGENISQFVIFVLLVRFLGPEEFGLVAFSAIFVVLAQGLASAGISQALVQRECWVDAVASTGFWLSLLLSVAFLLLIGGGAGTAIGMFYDERMGPIIAALSLIFVFTAARSTHEAKLQREFGFRTIALRSFLGNLLGGILGVVLAFQGWGAWALVVNRLVSSLIQTLVVWQAVEWKPAPVFDRQAAKELLAFGSYLSPASLIGNANRLGPEAVVGVVLGPTMVGIYRVGLRAVKMMQDFVMVPMQQTSMAAFSRLSTTESIGVGFIRLIRVCSLVAFPALFGAAAVAPEVVHLCFGPQWSGAAGVMSMFAIQGAVTLVLTFIPSALASTGRPKLALALNSFNLVATLAVAILLVQFGIFWVALGVAVRAYVSLFVGLSLMKIATNLSVRRALAQVMPSFVSASLMAGGVYFLSSEYLSGMSDLPRLALLVAAGLLVYPVLMLIVGRRALRAVMDDLQPILDNIPMLKLGKGSRKEGE